MKTIDRNSLRILQGEINAALEALGKKHGISLRTGKGSYGGDYATIKLEIGIVKNGKVVDRFASDFLEMAEYDGLKKTDLGRNFTFDANTYTLVGYNVKGRKRPFIGQNIADGKRYTFSPDMIKNRLV